jgi:hypothetical protein
MKHNLQTTVSRFRKQKAINSGSNQDSSIFCLCFPQELKDQICLQNINAYFASRIETFNMMNKQLSFH